MATAALVLSCGSGGSGANGTTSNGPSPTVLPCDQLPAPGVWEEITPPGSVHPFFDRNGGPFSSGIASFVAPPLRAGSVPRRSRRRRGIRIERLRSNLDTSTMEPTAAASKIT